MALKVDQCTDADMGRVFEIISTSFEYDHPYINAVFPKHDTPKGRKHGAERMLAFKKEDPTTTFVKVTDTTTGTIIAIAKWHVFDGVIPEEEHGIVGNYWESQDARELAEWNSITFHQLRWKAIRDSGGHLVSLDLMCVDPKHQKKGAGTLLMKWGTDIADKLGVEAVVEASVQGRRLYENFGFVVEQHVTMEPPARWAPENPNDKQRFLWMRRPAKTISHM